MTLFPMLTRFLTHRAGVVGVGCLLLVQVQADTNPVFDPLQSHVATLKPGESLLLTPALINSLAGSLPAHHAALKAAAARTQAADAEVQSVRVWEDPMFKFGGVIGRTRQEILSPGMGAMMPATTVTSGFMPEVDGDLVYGLDQKLPLFGKPASRRRVATAEADAERLKSEERFQLLRKDLAQGLFAAGLTEQTVRLSHEDLNWLETMVATMTERYRAGTATQVETLRVQNELARRQIQLAADRQRHEQSLATLNRLLGLEPSHPWPPLALPDAAAPLTNTPVLINLALRNEPRLRMLNQEIRVADARIDLTRRQIKPDLSVGIEGRQYSGDASFREGMFTISLNLPWFNGGKIRKEVARDTARRDAARQDLEDGRESIALEVRRLLTGIETARREARLYHDDILPRSTLALASAHAAWIAGRGMSIDVMEARRMVVEARLMEARAIAEQFSMLSELVLCCGMGDLDAVSRLMPATDTSTSIPQTQP